MSEIHQQNNETQQTPVLTLDPSSVAKEKVQLEETTQQLEAMAQAAPSATAAAQAPVPQAHVSPLPRSHTLILSVLSFII